MSAFCALYKVVLTMCSFFPPLFFIYITHCLTKTVKNTELNTKTCEITEKKRNIPTMMLKHGYGCGTSSDFFLFSFFDKNDDAGMGP